MYLFQTWTISPYSIEAGCPRAKDFTVESEMVSPLRDIHHEMKKEIYIKKIKIKKLEEREVLQHPDLYTNVRCPGFGL